MASPKSSDDGEMKDECSGKPQMTEAMETSTDVASSVLGKRKAEATGSEDPEGVDDEEVKDEEDSDPGWDKDSFDGREYESSDYSVYSDEEFRQKCRNYKRAVIETKGFFEPSDNFPLYRWTGIVSVSDDLSKEVDEGITVREFIGNMAIACVEKYNKRNNKTLQFDHFLRANFSPAGRTKYYITFAARETPEEPLTEYQAKVVWSAGKTYPIFCRPSPLPKSQETLSTT